MKEPGVRVFLDVAGDPDGCRVLRSFLDALDPEEVDLMLVVNTSRPRTGDAASNLAMMRSIEAMARPDLSHGKYPDLGRQRFWEITIMRVRPGHEEQLEAVAKTYKALATRSEPNAAWRVYQVTAGLPGPTFLIFSSMTTFGELDAMMASGEPMWKSIKPEEKPVFDKFGAEGMINAETNRYRLDPTMSYVSAETKAADPAFWSKK